MKTQTTGKTQFLNRTENIKKRKRFTVAAEDDDKNFFYIYSIPSQTQNPEEETFNNELKETLEREIEKLPEKYKIIFMMREIEKMDIKETSEILGISEVN